jgi:outer membrane autotransporter protein
MGGVDYQFLDNLILGVALTSERTRLNLEFVTGGGSIAGDGYSVAPYLGYAINRSWSLDASLGYGTTKYDLSGGGVTGNFRGSRTLGSVGLNYRYEGLGSRWVVNGRGALMSGTTRLSSFTLSNGTFVDSGSSSFNQLRLGGQVAYNAGTVRPYIGLTYVYDIKRPDIITVAGQSSAGDRDAWVPVFGLRFYGAGSAYGSLQLSSERGRSQIRNDQLLFNLGLRF